MVVCASDQSYKGIYFLLSRRHGYSTFINSTIFERQSKGYNSRVSQSSGKGLLLGQNPEPVCSSVIVLNVMSLVIFFLGYIFTF